MKLHLRGLAALAVATLAALLAQRASSHEFPKNTTITAFIKTEAREAHVLVRVPLDLLEAAQFPARGNEVDVPNAGDAVQRTLLGLAEVLALSEQGARLVPQRQTARLSLPSDRSFESYAEALAQVETPVEADLQIYYGQGHFDAHYVYPLQSAQSVLSIEPRFATPAGGTVKLAIRFMPIDGEERAMLVTSGSGRVEINPSFLQAAGNFIVLGVGHILGGADHLLFLLCLILPFRRPRDLLVLTLAFTVSHSLTLIAAAYGLGPSRSWFPPFIEAMIAASILYMAVENIVAPQTQRRWLITGVFGLVHGFGFSYALREDLQFAGSHLLVSLLSFNLGIEIGQLAVLAVMLTGLFLVLRGPLAGRTGIVLISVLAAHTGWHWLTERVDLLRQVEAPQMSLVVPGGIALGIVAVLVLLSRASRPAAAAVRSLRW